MLTRDLVKQLHRDVDDAIKFIADKYNLVSSSGGFSYNKTEGRVRVTFQALTENESGVIETPDERDFRLYADGYGLKPTDINRVFVSNGEKFKITGLKPSRRKYPVSAERVRDNKSFKFSSSIVSLLLV